MTATDISDTISSRRPAILDGIRVVDLSRFIAGPMCGMLLGDMGADVIKVERLGGEDSRVIQLDANGHSLYANWFNRNKRAITLDTRAADGLRVLEALLVKSDVLVENYRPGTLSKMGLTPQRLHELNPKLIVTSVSGFGQEGPLTDRAAFDSIAQAMSGLMSLTGDEASGPALTGAFVADHVAALYATLGTILALYEARSSGLGQRVDIALFDALFSCLGTAVPALIKNGERYGRVGHRDRFTAPSQAFPASDGHIYLSAGSDKLFSALLEVIDDDRLLAEPFTTPAGRMANRPQVSDLIGEWTATKTVAELCSLLESSGIPFGPVSTVEDVVTSEQVRHRKMIVSMEHPVAGECIVPGVTIKLSETPGTLRLAPPVVGEHTDQVLREVCGLSADEVEDLRTRKIV